MPPNKLFFQQGTDKNRIWGKSNGQQLKTTCARPQNRFPKGEAGDTFSLAAASRRSGQWQSSVTVPDHLLLSITPPPVKLSQCQKPAALMSTLARALHIHNGFCRWKQ